MTRKQSLCIAVLVSAARMAAYADRWGAIEQTEFFSEDRTHMLRIEPQSAWVGKPGHCLATLLRGETEVWSRCLVNDRAPVRVFVADSGEYVLTMDEWHRVGKLPVVIYGRRGELIRAHDTDSLGLAGDIGHINVSISSYWWNRGSVSFFGPEDETFLIRLHWGKWIVLDLRDGGIVQEDQMLSRDGLRAEHEKEWRQLVRYRDRELAARAIRMLDAEDAGDRKTGALVCGQEKLTDAVPALRRLAVEEPASSRDLSKARTGPASVRQTARDALEAMGQPVTGVITPARVDP